MTIEDIKQELKTSLSNYERYGASLADYSPSQVKSDRALLTAIVGLERINLQDEIDQYDDCHRHAAKSLQTIREQWSESN